METNIVVQDKTKESVVELSIVQSIYNIRGRKVMLDFDLAAKYEVETKRLKEQVKRNIERFPSDFMFELTKEELQLVAKCDQFPKRIKHSSVTPLAFTQEGVAMLSGVLRSQTAIDANIKIMRAFVASRNYDFNYSELKHDFENFKFETKTQIGDIYEVLDALIEDKQDEKPRNPIGFKQNNL
jgi:hypothetical protein